MLSASEQKAGDRVLHVKAGQLWGKHRWTVQAVQKRVGIRRQPLELDWERACSRISLSRTVGTCLDGAASQSSDLGTRVVGTKAGASGRSFTTFPLDEEPAAESAVSSVRGLLLLLVDVKMEASPLVAGAAGEVAVDRSALDCAAAAAAATDAVAELEIVVLEILVLVLMLLATPLSESYAILRIKGDQVDRRVKVRAQIFVHLASPLGRCKIIANLRTEATISPA